MHLSICHLSRFWLLTDLTSMVLFRAVGVGRKHTRAVISPSHLPRDNWIIFTAHKILTLIYRIFSLYLRSHLDLCWYWGDRSFWSSSEPSVTSLFSLFISLEGVGVKWFLRNLSTPYNPLQLLGLHRFGGGSLFRGKFMSSNHLSSYFTALLEDKKL